MAARGGPPSWPLGVPIIGGDPPLQEFDLVAVDVVAQEPHLGVKRVKRDVNPPGPGRSVLLAVPAVTASLQEVLVLEWRGLGPEPPARSPRPLQKV